MIWHYRGDDTGVQQQLGAMLQAFAGATVEAYCAAADRFLRDGRHPTLARGLLACGYLLPATRRGMGSPCISPRAVTGTSCGR
jgi:hypothetical protein